MAGRSAGDWLTSSPQQALHRIRRLCNASVAAIWCYQGIVPKLLGPHPDEVAMSAAFGVPPHLVVATSYAAGAVEVLLGLSVLLLQRSAWPQFVSAMSTAGLFLFAVIYVPHFLVGAFNPVVMNGASIALSVASLLALKAQSPGAD